MSNPKVLKAGRSLGKSMSASMMKKFLEEEQEKKEFAPKVKPLVLAIHLINRGM